MASDGGFNFEVSIDENIESVIDKIQTVSGLFSLNGEELLPVFDHEALLGLCSFIDSIIVKHVQPAVKRIVEDKIILETVVSESLDIRLLKEACGLITNFTSYHESSMVFMKYSNLVSQRMQSMWTTIEFDNLLPTTVASLFNLSTSKLKRKTLISVYPSILAETTSCLSKLKCLEKNKGIAFMNLYASFLANMTVSRAVRRVMLNPNDSWVIETIVEFLSPSYPTEIRKSISKIIKHLCVDYVGHEYLLMSPRLTILPIILLPLCGNETFTDEEYLSMPDDLQYLPSDKCREEDEEVRENLLVALEHLCRMKSCREKIRDSNTYLILRELHKFETNDKMLSLVESIVDLLICTESEITDRGLSDPPQPPCLEDWINGTMDLLENDDGEPETI